MNQEITLSYLYPFDWKDEDKLSAQFAEFQAAGYSTLSLTAKGLDRILAEPKFLIRLMMLAQDHKLRFSDAHGVWGPALGLGIGGRFPSLIPSMLEAHKKAMRYCADIGCRTYTVHTGAHEHIYFGVSVEKCRECIMRALEVLLPEAEKCGLIIALENNCENPGSADSLLPVFKAFASDHFGCCFDVGHAHYLLPEPKRPAMFYANGQEQFFCADPLKKLQPYIVTAHVHDNDQTGDWHKLPGHGTIDWNTVMPELLKSPRLLSVQSEAETAYDTFSIPELKDCFDRLMSLR